MRLETPQLNNQVNKSNVSVTPTESKPLKSTQFLDLSNKLLQANLKLKEGLQNSQATQDKEKPKNVQNILNLNKKLFKNSGGILAFPSRINTKTNAQTKSFIDKLRIWTPKVSQKGKSPVSAHHPLAGGQGESQKKLLEKMNSDNELITENSQKIQATPKPLEIRFFLERETTANWVRHDRFS